MAALRVRMQAGGARGPATPRPRPGSRVSEGPLPLEGPPISSERVVDPETMRRLFAALEDEEAEYVLIGAVALDAWGIGRLTEDVDLLVRATSANIERVRRALRRVWDDPEIEEIRAEDLGGPYPVVRYVAPDGSVVDLMARLGEAVSFEDVEATGLTYGDTEVRVATPLALFRMKRGTVRPQDRADAHTLKERFRLED